MRLLFWKRKVDEDGLPGRTGFWLTGILVLAAALRLINISKEPYWCDEVLSLDIATTFGSVSEMLRYVAQVEFHPPLYYLFIRPWAALFGTSEASIRSLSLIFGLGIVFMTYVIARRMFADRRIGLLAAGIVAILPIQIEYGQEARPYTMFCFAGCVAVYAAWRHLRSGGRAWAVLYVAATVFGLYLHYSYMFIAAATTLWWLVEASTVRGQRDRRLLDWLAAHAAVFIAFWPWMDKLAYKLLLGRFDIFGLKRNLVPYREPNFFGDLFESVIWVTKDRYVPTIQNLTVALVIGLFIWLAVKVACERKRKQDSGRTFAVLTALSVIPAVLFLVAPYSVPYTTIVERHVMWITVPIAIIIAAVAVRSGARRGSMLIAVFIASLLPYIVGIVGNDAYFDYDFRLEEGAGYINEHYREGDVVIVSVSILRSDLMHYLREDIPVETLVPVQDKGFDIWRGRHVLGLVENEMQVRIPNSSEEEIIGKFDWVERKHEPRRIWLYGFNKKNAWIDNWFDEETWRRSFRSIGGILPLDMYTKR